MFQSPVEVGKTVSVDSPNYVHFNSKNIDTVGPHNYE